MVKLTKNGIRIIDRNPNIRIDKIATRYPSRLVLYSTIENETASQKGHFTFVDLNDLAKEHLLLFKEIKVILLIMILEEVCSRTYL